MDWSQADADLLAYTARLIALRERLQPMGDRWHRGVPGANGDLDLDWLQADGTALAEADWRDAGRRVLGARIGAPGRGPAPLLLLFNGEAEDRAFTLPEGRWKLLLDSAVASPADTERVVDRVCPLRAQRRAARRGLILRLDDPGAARRARPRQHPQTKRAPRRPFLRPADRPQFSGTFLPSL